MEQKKIAIIHSRDSSLVTLLARLTQELGHDPSTMVVNKDTPPQDVASFVQGISPLSLVLLAENYISYNDPFVQAYLRQNEYKVTSEGIEGIKGGEKENDKASTLSNDQHADKKFDYIISNPPYGVEWKKDKEVEGVRQLLNNLR